jgi:hypothetical protein
VTGLDVGDAEGEKVGDPVGLDVGDLEGAKVVGADGLFDGLNVGDIDGENEGVNVLGARVGVLVGLSVVGAKEVGGGVVGLTVWMGTPSPARPWKCKTYKESAAVRANNNITRKQRWILACIFPFLPV